jgi:hypothetical protein
MSRQSASGVAELDGIRVVVDEAAPAERPQGQLQEPNRREAGLVDRVEYYLGDYFFSGNSVSKTNAEEAFRLDIPLYGPPTNCVARVYFKDGTPPATMDRYLDYALPDGL